MQMNTLDVHVQKDLLIESAFEFVEAMRVYQPNDFVARAALYKFLMAALKFALAVEQEATRRERGR